MVDGENTLGEHHNFRKRTWASQGKNDLHSHLNREYEFKNCLWTLQEQNDCYKPKNRGSLLPIHTTIQKWIYGHGKMRKRQKKCEGEIPTIEHYKNDLPSLEKMKKTVKIVKGKQVGAPAV